MQRPSGTAAVRLSLWMLIFAAFAMALVQPVQAGTEAAPEIQDPAGDQAVGGAGGPLAPCDANCVGNGVDVVTVWIDNETVSQFNINVRTTGDIIGGQPFPLGGTPVPNLGSDEFAIAFTVGGTEFAASVDMAAGTATVGDAANAAAVAGNLMTVTILKSAVGNPTAGAVLSALSVEVTRAVEGTPLLGDRAPNEGGGTDYTFTGGGAAPVDPDDTDGDGMNDTCEQQYFGNVTAQNATGDPDGDGLTNGQECALGTDPTKADSDGDGRNDKDDPAPTDPTQGGTSSSSSSTTSGSRSSSSTSRSSTGGSTTGVQPGGDGGDDDDVESFGDAVEKLKADPGYLGLSGGGFLAVLVLCIIALAVRWSL
jgi:hypothetical protein